MIAPMPDCEAKAARQMSRFKLVLTPSCAKTRLCLLFIHPRAPNLINLRSASTMPA